MAQFIAVYYAHGGTMMAEANGPYRSRERAEQEVQRIATLEAEVDPYYQWNAHVVELGAPNQVELDEAFRDSSHDSSITEGDNA